MLPLFPLAPFGYDIISNISLAEKGDHYNTILQYGLRSVRDQADSSLDLVLQVSDSEGQMIHVSIIVTRALVANVHLIDQVRVHSSLICLHSPFLRSLLRSRGVDKVLVLPEVSILMSYQMDMYVCLVSVNVLLCRLIMGPFGPCWVFSTQEGIPYYRNVHVSAG